MPINLWFYPWYATTTTWTKCKLFSVLSKVKFLNILWLTKTVCSRKRSVQSDSSLSEWRVGSKQCSEESCCWCTLYSQAQAASKESTIHRVHGSILRSCSSEDRELREHCHRDRDLITQWQVMKYQSAVDNTWMMNIVSGE